MEGSAPGPAKTPPLDPAVAPDIPPTEPDPLTADGGGTYREARQGDDLQRIRQHLDRLGPAVLVLAWFAAMAVMYLAIIARLLKAH